MSMLPMYDKKTGELLDINMKPISIKFPVSAQHQSYSEDYAQAKKAMTKFGYYQPGDDEPEDLVRDIFKLYRGIKRFQKDNGLKQDGKMFPNGETERAINHKIKASERAVKPENDLKENPFYSAFKFYYNNPEARKKLQKHIV